MQIRPFQPEDLAALYAINQAGVPGVGNAETEDDLGALISMGTCLVAISGDGTPIGFINLVAPGTAAYESDNLRWIENWMTRQQVIAHYVDRIAIGETARGRGVGEALYRAAFEAAKPNAYLCCEVNTDPTNPGSHRFHQRLGFNPIGDHRYRADYAVRFYARDL
ncbi:GNAT family N-acetyltransferase [Henriciella marina]|uniref:GNAT family N-acetyltransferase n=1 Tax=Henriciella marina TaxID=453851 RepID=A0ABT4LTZ5_9PROT|nr:GNAT family N-acetyltransferase [Henriciella marina]MCZ4297602.1 GNAT family N-acetyltransferase [Henriciella marina]